MKGGEGSRVALERYASLCPSAALSLLRDEDVRGASWDGGGLNASSCAVSISRIEARLLGCSHGGGVMFARFWRLRRRASQRGRGVGKGGVKD